MYKNGKTGISPVIGVILLVAITVALVSLATVIVFDIGSDVNEPSSSSVQTSIGSNGVQVQVLRNDNVEQFEVIGPDGKTDNIDGDVGGSLNIGDGAGQYLVKAILDDGSEEVIDTITVNEGSTASEVRTGTEEDSGTVSVNPNVEGAIVQSIEDGFVIDETTTDENGEYTIEYSEDSEILVMVDGFDHEELDHTLYASSKRMDLTDNIDFSFEDSVATVNNENVLIANTVTEEDTNVKTVATIQELQAMNEELDVDYELVNDIDASETVDWNGDKGFEPIGNTDGYEWGDGFEGDVFTGNFDGQEYKINDLYINRIDEDLVGVFRGIEGGTIENVKIINNNVMGGEQNVGGLMGLNKKGKVNNLYINGNTEGEFYVGGLIGYNNEGKILNSYSKGNVDSSGDYVGGIVGENFEGFIDSSSFEGNVSGESFVGGFVGYNHFGEIKNAYSEGNTTGYDRWAGGLVGLTDGDAIINKSHTSVHVNGKEIVGGFAGGNSDGGKINNAYSTGNVTGEEIIGGFAGINEVGIAESKINNAYSTGNVTGEEIIGGLIGQMGNNLLNPDEDIILHNSYVLKNNLDDKNKVIGKIIEEDGEGDIIIKQGETTLADDGNTFVEDIEQDLIDEFIRSEEEFQDENELEQLDFDESWIITDNFPELQWQE